ncbi:MAG: SpoIIIAH-like family protein, partial [Oscillospiraceae bacterium]|nr:SpoIIIAH-like family protein [Oscillospiraceae bacterium]
MSLMNLWKRNAVVATVVLFVTMALYLSWSYNRDENAVNGPGWDGDDTVYTLLDVVDAAKTGNTAPPTVSPEVQTDGGAGQNSYFIEQRLSRQKARDG